MLSAEYLAYKTELGDYSGVRKELVRYATIVTDNSFCKTDGDGRQRHYRQTQFLYEGYSFDVLMLNGEVQAIVSTEN